MSKQLNIFCLQASCRQVLNLMKSYKTTRDCVHVNLENIPFNGRKELQRECIKLVLLRVRPKQLRGPGHREGAGGYASKLLLYLT